MFEKLLKNHVLANLLFVLVMVMGVSSYLVMPREQDPSINFNWIDITTLFPGASTLDVESQVTDIIEDAIKGIPDIKFVSSNSREGLSSILIRFDEIKPLLFEKRLADLRREIESIQEQLPEVVIDPFITEITTSNAFPSATVVVSGLADDDNLRRQAAMILQDIEQIKGVDRVLDTGLSDPELQVNLDLKRLDEHKASPTDIADTIRLYYQNLSAGKLDINDSTWSIKISGSSIDAHHISNLPILGRIDDLTIGHVASVRSGKTEALRLVRYKDRPAVMFGITKQEGQNILELVERIQDYIHSRESLSHTTGVEVWLADDQTEVTRDALDVMQKNALLGLVMVLIVTWLFLGTGISILTGIAIPFILAGTFWALKGLGQTLNVQILLGVVISLGMLVDDAVVVVESIYYRLQRGADTVKASIAGLNDVIVPVTTAVLTTMAAFMPLMLLPGILGKFMFVIPLVVTLALAISLVEAFWLLPSHIMNSGINFDKPSKIHLARERAQRKIRRIYTRILIKVIRFPLIALTILFCIFLGAGYAIAKDHIKKDFFASDPVRLFYINVQMPSGTSLQSTMEQVSEIESHIAPDIDPDEVRSIVSYAGQMFTQTEPFFGDQYGQIQVSLNPQTGQFRSVDEVMDSIRDKIFSIPGPEKVSFLRIAGGPPTARDVSVKVRGNNRDEIVQAMNELQAFMRSREEFKNIIDDDLPGQSTLDLKLNQLQVQKSGIRPDTISRTLRILVDGETVSEFRHQGETIEVKLQNTADYRQLSDLLNFRLTDKNGNRIPLSQLVEQTTINSPGTIRHYNFRRTITLEADINKELENLDIIKANDLIKQHWESIKPKYPNVNLDFSGILDDLEESLNAIYLLFLLGLGLIYLILGTQFKSYFQPFLIITTVPMAFTGVVIGLLISGNPLSLYTLYGVVALAGIAVNSAIVLISTANKHIERGTRVLYATIYAAKRRIIPILITSLTTVAGLFSLATGLGGASLLWGPIATSIVWGLCVSTLLTLFIVPLLYRIFMSKWRWIALVRNCTTKKTTT